MLSLHVKHLELLLTVVCVVASRIPNEYMFSWFYTIIDEPSELITKQVDLVEHYRNSDQFKNLQEKLTPIVDSVSVRDKRKVLASYATSSIWQVWTRNLLYWWYATL